LGLRHVTHYQLSHVKRYYSADGNGTAFCNGPKAQR
jgi:hypothetical protein